MDLYILYSYHHTHCGAAMVRYTKFSHPTTLTKKALPGCTIRIEQRSFMINIHVPVPKVTRHATPKNSHRTRLIYVEHTITKAHLDPTALEY